SYGGQVSEFTFRAKRLVSDKVIILEVPCDIPKLFELLILSEIGRIGRGQSIKFLGRVELDVRRIISTDYTHSDVHKLFERGPDGTNNLQTGEISFEISWQLTDPRASETRDHDHGDLGELSETNHIYLSSQVPRVSQALDDDQESSEDERGAGQRPTVIEGAPIIGGPSRERVGRRSDRISARYIRPRSPSVRAGDGGLGGNVSATNCPLGVSLRGGRCRLPLHRLFLHSGKKSQSLIHCHGGRKGIPREIRRSGSPVEILMLAPQRQAVLSDTLSP
ncbi:hypothetical protein FocTR4_00015088, partial [Fusarium oxysporum f. sp. cubense]